MDAALTAPPPTASKMVESIKEKVQAVDTKGTILEKLIKEAKNTDQQETGYDNTAFVRVASYYERESVRERARSRGLLLMSSSNCAVHMLT